MSGLSQLFHLMCTRPGCQSSCDVTAALTNALVEAGRIADGQRLATAASFNSTEVWAVQELQALLTFGPHGCTAAMYGRSDTPMAWGLLCQVDCSPCRA